MLEKNRIGQSAAKSRIEKRSTTKVDLSGSKKGNSKYKYLDEDIV